MSSKVTSSKKAGTKMCFGSHSYLHLWKVFIVVMLAGCAGPHFNATHEQVEQRIAAARTRVDHLGLAQFFDQEAEEAKKRAQSHQNMIKRYGDRRWTGRASGRGMSEHCKRLVEYYAGVEQESRALAVLHRELAGEASE